MWMYLFINTLCAVCGYLLFDMFAARHRVSHASTGEDVHIVNNDKRFLFQRDDGEVVFICILIAV